MADDTGGGRPSLFFLAFGFVVVLACGGWIAHHALNLDRDTANYLAVVSRHTPELDDAVVGIEHCGPDVESCRAALRTLKTAAASYEADLPPAPCDDEANRELWAALNGYLEAVARLEPDLDQRHAPLRGIVDNALQSAMAHQQRADALLSTGNVCPKSGPDAAP
jgi:hypothetical protein